MRSIRLLISGFICSFVFFACSSPDVTRERSESHRKESPRTTSPTSAQPTASSAVKIDDPAYKEALSEFRKKNYSKVIELTRNYERSGRAKNPTLGAMLNLQGLSYLMDKNSTKSIQSFQNAIRQHPNPQTLPYYQYNLATAQMQGQVIEDAFLTVTEINSKALDEETQDKLAILKAKIYRKKDLPGEAIRELLEAIRTTAKPQINRELEIQLETISDRPVLTALANEFQMTPGGDLIQFHLASLDYREGNLQDAQNRLKEISQTTHNPDLAEKANELISKQPIDSAQEEVPFIETDPKAIGVLLPMTGKFAEYGKDALQSIALGLQIFGPLKGAAPFEIVIEDTGDTEKQALEALDRLVQEHHVIAIIGPLSSKNIDAIAQRASQLGVPLLSLAQKDPPPTRSVFSLGLTPKAQTEALAKYATEKLGFKRFAILAPESKFGTEYSQSFWDAIESRGGSIVAYELYPEGQTDFRQFIDKMSGLAQTGARLQEIEELARLRAKDKIKKRTRKAEHYFALPPIVDFDAVFLPDEAKIVGQALPTFKYRDIDKVQFLGPSTWRSQDLLDRAGKFAEGAILSDAFLETSDDPQVRQFVERFRATFGRIPGLIDALSYDAAQILYQSLNRAGQAAATHRNEVPDKILSVQKFQGVTGQFEFSANKVERNLKLIAIRNNQFAELPEQ